MELDPVLHRATAVRLHGDLPHHLPDVHDRAVGLHRHAAGDVGRDRPGPLPAAGAVLDPHLRGLVRDGRRLRDRAVLSVRHQLEPLLGVRRQHRRPADRLRGADRVFPGGDLPRHHAVRLGPGAALAAGDGGDRGRRRHHDLRLLDPGGEQLDAHARPATRSSTASPCRSTGGRSSSTRASRTASPTCSTPPILTAGFVVLAVGARYLAGRPPSGAGPHHDQDGGAAAGGAGAAAAADRRPARAQHAQASADQDRRDGGALGQRQAGRLPHLRLAR